MDPRTVGSERLLVENTGGGWSISDWSPDDQWLCIREYLSINRSHLYLVHVSTGERRKLTFGEEEIAVGSAKFKRGWSGLWVTCDLGSEFQRLGFLDIKSGAFQPLTSDIEWNIESLLVSPDGQRIVFVSNEAGVSRLYSLDPSSRRYRRSTMFPKGLSR